MTKKTATPDTPKMALRKWAFANEITPAQFAKRTGFTYQYAWGLISGDEIPTVQTLGTILVSYGTALCSPLVEAFQRQADFEAQS